LTQKINFGRKFFLSLALLCIGSIAVFRGDVGTDTFSYEKIASDIRADEGLEGLEVGFASLIRIFQVFLIDDRFVIRAISVVYCLLLLIYILEGNKEEIFYLFAFYFPAFFYTSSMNVLRVGFSSAFILLAIQFLRKKSFLKTGFYFLIAISFHYSAFFLGAYLWVLFGMKSVKLIIRFLIIFLPIGFLLIYLNIDYFLDKIILYSEVESPSSLSGLGLIFPSLILLFGVWGSNLSLSVKIKLVCWALINLGFFYLLAFFYYAGLRFLGLTFFALSLSIIMAHEKSESKLNFVICAAFVLSGLLSFFAAYNGWLLTTDTDGAPFLPYKYFWQT